MSTLKRCPSCDEDKALEEFSNNRATKDGKDQYCKPCRNEKSRAYMATKPGYHKRYYREVRKPQIEAGRKALAEKAAE